MEKEIEQYGCIIKHCYPNNIEWKKPKMFISEWLREQIKKGIIKRWDATKNPKKYLIEF